MPLLFALSQHRALRSVQSHLSEDERLLAFHDDIYIVSQPERTCELYGILARELWAHSRIRINGGKTQIWNRGGFIPPGHDALLAIARQDDPAAQIWFGDHAAPESERGIRVLGTPLGSNAFVRAQLQAIGESHELLLSRIPAIQVLQSAWLLLLFCAVTRATFYLRVCHPEHSVHFAHQHDVGVWQCFCSLLGQPLHSAVPTPFGRVGVAECFSHDPCRLLGQLGILFEHNSAETRQHCPDHGTSPRFAPGDSYPLGWCSLQPCHVGFRGV